MSQQTGKKELKSHTCGKKIWHMIHWDRKKEVVIPTFWPQCRGFDRTRKHLPCTLLFLRQFWLTPGTRQLSSTSDTRFILKYDRFLVLCPSWNNSDCNRQIDTRYQKPDTRFSYQALYDQAHRFPSWDNCGCNRTDWHQIPDSCRAHIRLIPDSSNSRRMLTPDLNSLCHWQQGESHIQL